MSRAAAAITIVTVIASTLLMIGLPIVLLYALWGVGGAIAGVIIALAFWLLMGTLYVRARRRTRAA